MWVQLILEFWINILILPIAFIIIAPKSKISDKISFMSYSLQVKLFSIN